MCIYIYACMYIYGERYRCSSLVGSLNLSSAQADRSTATLNKMLEEQHWLLDHKVVDCREKRSSAGEAVPN